MNKLLFALTVHDRIRELRLQETLIRYHFGNNVGLHVFCNCPEEQKEKYKDLLEDKFHWKKNTGHSQGALDHANMALDVIDDYEYILLLAAKTILTDYTIIDKIICDMKSQNKTFAIFNDNGLGHFRNKNLYGFYCDFILATKDSYKKIFPLNHSDDSFPEIIVTNKVFNSLRKDEVFYIPCTPPDPSKDIMIFKNIYGTEIEAISTRDFPEKLQYLKTKNERYALIYEKMLDVKCL